MKAGSSLADVAQRVQAQRASARDFLAASPHISLHVAEGAPRLVLNDGTGALRFGMSDVVHDQLADVTGIPAAYYRRLQTESPDLLAINANTWLARSDARRMVRTISGTAGQPLARALLSSRYRPLDHWSLLDAVLPTIAESGLRIESCELTERRLYLKAVSERVQGEVKPGEVVSSGVVLMNSEVGLGAVTVSGLLYTLRCRNGLIQPDASLRQHHVGRRHSSDGEFVEQMLSDEARSADDAALFLRVRDVVRGALDETRFLQRLKRLRLAAQDKIDAKEVTSVVDVTAKRFGLDQGESQSVLAHLIAGGDLSQWGLVSAITRAAQDVSSYDRSTELERIGGRLIELPRKEWSSLAALN